MRVRSALEAQTLMGSDVQKHRGVYSLKYPCQRGVIQDWDDMQRVWGQAFRDLRVQPDFKMTKSRWFPQVLKIHGIPVLENSTNNARGGHCGEDQKCKNVTQSKNDYKFQQHMYNIVAFISKRSAPSVVQSHQWQSVGVPERGDRGVSF
jgi:actin-related protein